MYSILRVERIRRIGDLAGASAHGARTDAGTHYDPARRHLNRHWRLGLEVAGPVDLLEARRALIAREGLVERKNGAVAAEMLLSASGDFFFDREGQIDQGRLDRWVQRNLDCVAQRFPRMVAAARLDLDEGTPHLAVFLVPFYTKSTKNKVSTTLSYRRVFGGATRAKAREKMRALQDWYAAEMAEFGLRRGVPRARTGRQHLTHHQYAQRKRQEEEKRRCDLAAAEAARKIGEERWERARRRLGALERLQAELDRRDAELTQRAAALDQRAEHLARLIAAARRSAAAIDRLANAAAQDELAGATRRLADAEARLRTLAPPSPGFRS